jgi:hypothetical protein
MKRVFSIMLDNEKEVFICSELILAEKATEAIKNLFPNRSLSIHDIFICENENDINNSWHQDIDLI